MSYWPTERRLSYREYLILLKKPKGAPPGEPDDKELAERDPDGGAAHRVQVALNHALDSWDAALDVDALRNLVQLQFLHLEYMKIQEMCWSFL